MKTMWNLNFGVHNYSFIGPQPHLFIYLLFMAMKVELSRDQRASKVLNIYFMLFKEKLLTSEIEVDGRVIEQIRAYGANNSTEGMLSLRILWHIQETVERCIYSTGKELDLRNING